MRTSSLKITAFMILSCATATAAADKICGLVTDDQPEISRNLDELRRFTMKDKAGASHFIVTEIDPDFIRGAPLRAIREAKQNRMEICVTGHEMLGTERKQFLVMTVDRDDHKLEIEEPLARAPGADKTIRK